MGTFAGYFGEMNIPEERLPEYTERMLKLMNHGGMMTLDGVEVQGSSIKLLSLPRVDYDNRIDVWYNYFEEDWWEGTSVQVTTGRISDGKIGGREFCLVTLAAYVLAEFYSDTHMIAEVDGQVFSADRIIGWLNHLFSETYTNARTRNMWDIYKLLPDYARHQKLLAIPKEEDYLRVSGFGFMTYMMVNDPETLKSEIAELTASEGADKVNSFTCFAKVLDRLRKVKDSFESPEAALDHIKKLLQADAKTVSENFDKESDALWIMFRFLSRDLVLTLVADVFELDFWQLLEEMSQSVAEWVTIEDMYQVPFAPVKPMDTATFLGCCEDDRAFWWKSDNRDVVFSKEMEAWLADLSDELKEILDNEEGLLIPTGEFFMTLLKTLEEAAASYRRVYAFSSMFQEFLGNSTRREYQAAVILLQRLLKRHEEEIPELKEARWTEQLCLPGRNNIKRYLAVLANTELRQAVFGF